MPTHEQIRNEQTRRNIVLGVGIVGIIGGSIFVADKMGCNPLNLPRTDVPPTSTPDGRSDQLFPSATPRPVEISTPTATRTPQREFSYDLKDARTFSETVWSNGSLWMIDAGAGVKGSGERWIKNNKGGWDFSHKVSYTVLASNADRLVNLQKGTNCPPDFYNDVTQAVTIQRGTAQTENLAVLFGNDGNAGAIKDSWAVIFKNNGLVVNLPAYKDSNPEQKKAWDALLNKLSQVNQEHVLSCPVTATPTPTRTPTPTETPKPCVYEVTLDQSNGTWSNASGILVAKGVSVHGWGDRWVETQPGSGQWIKLYDVNYDVTGRSSAVYVNLQESLTHGRDYYNDVTKKISLNCPVDEGMVAALFEHDGAHQKIEDGWALVIFKVGKRFETGYLPRWQESNPDQLKAWKELLEQQRRAQRQVLP